MKKNLILLTAMLLVVPSFVLADVVSFKVGYFIPRANDDPWETEFANMNFDKSNFQTTNFGFSYDYFISNYVSVTFSVSGYNKSKSGVYEGYVGYDTIGDSRADYAFELGGTADISHVFRVAITPIQVGIRFAPLGRKGKFIPYLGGGIGAYLWSMSISGSMIDFASPELFPAGTIIQQDIFGYPIFSDDLRVENKIRIGFHGEAGIMVPIASRISLMGEVKYEFAKAPFSQLEGMKYIIVGYEFFDLSGLTIGLGLNYWF